MDDRWGGGCIPFCSRIRSENVTPSTPSACVVNGRRPYLRQMMYSSVQKTAASNMATRTSTQLAPTLATRRLAHISIRAAPTTAR